MDDLLGNTIWHSYNTSPFWCADPFVILRVDTLRLRRTTTDLLRIMGFRHLSGIKHRVVLTGEVWTLDHGVTVHTNNVKNY